ncbi:MAG TPA: MEDS domain-containing protein [Candidatus Binatia bacterium]|nr:MEDS domain-containing protein [Candidatus Binatia bacterium]
MTSEMRATGIEVVGDMPWGTHFCLFYDTKSDLLETLAPYCKAGLENGEYCLWVVAEPVQEAEACAALARVLPDFDRYLREQSIEIVGARDWYLHQGEFDLDRVIRGWNEKLARATARGYTGVRVTGDTAWLSRKDWRDFCEYEESLNQAIANQNLAVLCTYPLAACSAVEILDVVQTHQFTVAKRQAKWEVIETAGHKQAKAQIKRLNEELEQRVRDRTRELTELNDELEREVIERKRAESALLRSEAYLAEAQRISHTGSFGWEVSSGEIYWSAETFRILECDPADSIPSTELVLRRTHPDDRTFVQKVIDRAIAQRKDFDIEHRFVMPGGEVKNVRVVGHPSVNQDSGNFEFVGAVMDVTQRHQADAERERLRDLQADLAHITRMASMGELTASLAHEIKQPMAAAVTDAKTCLLWLERPEPEIGEAREAVSRTVKDVTRAADIINRIGSLFKKGPTQRESVDVNLLVREMIELLRSEASRYSISICAELAPELPTTSGDVVQLRQVLMNLMLNGIDAMKETHPERRLTVKSEETDGGQIQVSVSDTGVGLKPQQAEQVFDTFFTTKPQGLGMGLPISRSIVESHGGRLWAGPNRERGATFHFTLPAETAASSISAA